MAINKAPPNFRLSYIAFPAGVLFISLVITAVFYPRLTVELGYHFQGDGSPDRWMNRNLIILIMLVPQLILTLTAAGTTWGVTKLSSKSPPLPQTGVKTRIIALMGNMTALPQLVLGFAMLDIYIYDAYRIHIMPLWIFAVIVMAAGGIVLGVSFLRAAKEARQATK